MRELSLAGFVAIVFGLGSFYATHHFGAFSAVNLAAGGLALAVALVRGARRVRLTSGRYSRALIRRGLLLVVLSLVAAIGLERAAAWSDIRFDLTFERRYQIAPALVKLLHQMPGLVIDLFYDPQDPRIRRTRYLLQEIARHGQASVQSFPIDSVPKDLDRYGVHSSNTVLLRHGGHFEVVERPTQGAIYEALYHLESVHAGVLGLLRGEGEGDPELQTELGYGGLASVLTSEGYELRSLVTMAMREVPDDVKVVVAIAPRRRIRREALDALRRFLARGGGLVALIEPGTESGLEDVLSEWGLRSPDEVLVDPAYGEGDDDEPAGLCPLVYNYETHPVTQGLDRNRMTFFCGVRSFDLRKPRVDDSLRAVVQSSPHAWLSRDLSLLKQRGGSALRGQHEGGYHPIAATGHYERDGVETRILAFGDADFASNRYLRALYNLDLITNGIHWTAEREPQIAIRPKIRETVQFPLPVQNSLEMLYGVGLLVPEVLIVAGGVVWLRRRRA